LTSSHGETSVSEDLEMECKTKQEKLPGFPTLVGFEDIYTSQDLITLHSTSSSELHRCSSVWRDMQDVSIASYRNQDLHENCRHPGLQVYQIQYYTHQGGLCYPELSLKAQEITERQCRQMDCVSHNRCTPMETIFGTRRES
jgi:hypothetical protein